MNNEYLRSEDSTEISKYFHFMQVLRIICSLTRVAKKTSKTLLIASFLLLILKLRFLHRLLSALVKIRQTYFDLNWPFAGRCGKQGLSGTLLYIA